MGVWNRKQSGFTLIELLVVIAVIAILATIGLGSYRTAQIRARNAKRIADVKAIKDAQEQYYLDSGNTYASNPGLLSSYFPQGFPAPPPGTTLTAYQVSLTGVNACICAQMEQIAGASQGNASNASCNFGTGDYYCIVGQQ